MEVNDSDHKPVYAVLAVQLPWYQQQQQRSSSLGRLWQAAAAAAAGSSSFSSSSTYADGSSSSGGSLSLLVDQQQLLLQGSYAPAALQLRNPSQTSCMFAVQSSGPGGALPTWLEVSPAAGVIGPGGCLTVRVQGTKAAQWQAAGGLRCELCVLGCLQGSVDSSRWPVACYRDAPHVHVMLP
jgi:hypothetical protein